MRAYSESYLEQIVETQGRLFDQVASRYPDKDTEDFITAFMKGRTRKFIDDCQAYVITMSASELWAYFCKVDGYCLKNGKAMEGFLPDWIGEFYCYFQWYYNIPSREVIQRVPLDFLKRAYWGLHDLDLKLAVEKVGKGL